MGKDRRAKPRLDRDRAYVKRESGRWQLEFEDTCANCGRATKVHTFKGGIAMPRVAAFYSVNEALKPSGQRVYHDRTYVVEIDVGASDVRLQCWQSDQPHIIQRMSSLSSSVEFPSLT